MENLKLSLPFIFFLITTSFHFAEAQTKIYLGVGLMATHIESSSFRNYTETGYSHRSPSLSFSIEDNQSEHFFLSLNASYANFEALTSLPGRNSSTELKFNQISIGGLVNYRILSINENKSGNLNYGIGLNFNYLSNYRTGNFGSIRKLPDVKNCIEIGFIHQVSWGYRNFKLSLQQTNGLFIIGGRKVNFKSTGALILTIGYTFLL